MRLSKLVLFFILAFSLTSYAKDDVMIDLSVLDSLGSDFIAPSEPLFPTLPKKVKLPSKPKITSKKKAAAVIKPDVKPVKTEEKIVVVDIEPVDNFSNESEKENVAVANKTPITDEVKVVDVEPVAVEPIAEVVSKTPKDMMEENKESEGLQANQKENISSSTETELLIDEVSSIPMVPTSINNSIVFDDSAYELSNDQISQIDKIIGNFKDANTNKIAIYSYNLDDGIDTFKKKRISLNRAVEIRSHLIKQGYKNFSIKVININTDSDKINTVELEEI